MSERNNRIFDEYPRVDCEDCNHWWNNSCDGVKKGSERLCNAFIATRNVIIPQEIEELKKALRRLSVSLALLGLSELLLVVWLCGCVGDL